jgi:hypothetical protein
MPLWVLIYLPFTLVPMLLVPATAFLRPVSRRTWLTRCAWAVVLIHIVAFNGIVAEIALPYMAFGDGFSLINVMQVVLGPISIVLLCVLAFHVRRLATEFSPPRRELGGATMTPSSQPGRLGLQFLLATLPAAAAMLLWLLPAGDYTREILSRTSSYVLPSRELIIRGVLLNACCFAWVVPWALAPRGRAWVGLLLGGVVAAAFSALALVCFV